MEGVVWKIGMAISQRQSISRNCHLVLGPTYIPVKNIKAMFPGARKKEKSQRLNVGTKKLEGLAPCKKESAQSFGYGDFACGLLRLARS